MTGPQYVLTPAAASDLAEILDHIALDSVEAALRVHDRFLHVFDMLAERPGAGHQRDDLTSRPVRFFPVFSYVVIYFGNEEPIQLLRVLNMARDVAGILEEPPGGHPSQ